MYVNPDPKGTLVNAAADRIMGRTKGVVVPLSLKGGNVSQVNRPS
jgi:hypothetical protein